MDAPADATSRNPSLPAPKIVLPLRAPPQRGRVLVVAPHPDDESIGPGATLALHARLGDPIHAVFVTSGVHGDPQRDTEPADYVALRRSEAEAAAKVLGIATTEFWDLPDGCEVTEADLEAVVERLADRIARERPDVVYAPHAGESHSDHHFVALATARARERAWSKARLLGYEVWSPLSADLVVDVTETYASKQQAVRCYASQLAHTDILGAIEGLNRYRAILLPDVPADGGHRAEAFQEVR